MASTFNARSAEAYELSMGRWSRRLAPGFIAFAGLAAGDKVLDAGCGTGSLTFALAEDSRAPQVSAVDASDIYVRAAQARAGDARISIRCADICALPFADGSFDRAFSQLVLQFVPDTAAAAAEMRRVVRPGGTVAAAVWASGGGMPHQRMFWDTAAQLDPEAARLRDRTFSRPMTARGELGALWSRMGLAEIEESALTIWMEFAGFADFWGPIASGEGTLGKYVGGLAEDRAAALRDQLAAAYAAGQPDGPRAFAATACVCRGIVPAS